jgi:hypothetical protein
MVFEKSEIMACMKEGYIECADCMGKEYDSTNSVLLDADDIQSSEYIYFCDICSKHINVQESGKSLIFGEDNKIIERKVAPSEPT